MDSIPQKRCYVCKEYKSLTEFPRNRNRSDGFDRRCLICNSAAARAYKERRKAEGTWIQYHPPSDAPKRCATCQQIKTATEFGIDRNSLDGRNYSCRLCRRGSVHPNHYTHIKAYRERYPERRRARGAVNDAVRRGKMVAATALMCAECGNLAAHYHHHHGYDKEHRLDVIPLCTACHAIADLNHATRP